MSRYLAVLFGAGGVLAHVSLLVPHASEIDELGVRIVASSAFPPVALLLLAGPRLPRFVFHLLLLCGTAIITLGIYFGQDAAFAPTSSIFYIWVALYAFTFFSPLAACGHVLAIAVAYGTELVLAGTRDDLSQWLLVVGTVLVTGFVVGRLAEDNLVLAGTDPLTRLPNRRAFDKEVEVGLARRERRDCDLCVVVVDLDHFKYVNDTLGHSAGDEFLVTCAARLASCIRDRDVAARLGGDEFAILLEGKDARRAEQIVTRLLDAFREPVTVRGHEIVVGASVGIAYASDGTTADDLLRNADLAMYCAKAAGRGRYEIYDGSMHERAVERLQLEEEFRQAVASDALSVEFQPIVSIETNEIRGVEVLARWYHPTRGPIGPAVFIPIAERTGLIRELGQRIFEQACRTAKRIHDIDPGLDITVNLSPLQLADPDLVPRFGAALSEAGVDPARIVLEVTENALMRDVVASAERIAELKRLGVRIAVDDFGVGHSSLSYLRNFPVDILKIDKSFVDTLPTSGSELAKAIIQLGSMLGLDVIAEGIESARQLDELQALGCPRAQGFLFAAPMAETQLLLQLATPRPARAEQLRVQ